MYHFIYSNKDSYVDELKLNAEYNFGADESLVLKKDFDGKVGLNGVTRIMVQFDLTEVSKSIVSGEITNPEYYLKLYQKKTFELSSNSTIKAFPISSSWIEGTGYRNQNPNSRDGVSWKKSNETFFQTSWSLEVSPLKFNAAGDTFSTTDQNFNAFGGSSGSRGVAGGGIWIMDEESDPSAVSAVGGGYEASQSISYQSPDISMNVSDIVSKWLNGTIENNGFVVKWSALHENSVSKSGNIEYFSRQTESPFSPQIELRWDDHAPVTGSNTGSLTQLTIDGTQDNYLYMINLRKEYRETETPRFRVGSRTRYMTKSPSFTKSTTSTLFIPEKSGSYSIVDAASGKTIVPFGNESFLSCDSTSNYFKQKLSGFINNRLYRIKLKLKTNDNKEIIFDDDFEFKVVK
jgi:hypothetical protein